MIQLTRIYTRGGDRGKTSLGSGERVSKNSDRIEAIGVVDELNAMIGVLITECELQHKDFLVTIQHDLFDIGADLCVTQDPNAAPVLRLTTHQVDRLEEEIDALNAFLSPLRSFVLPGGRAASAHCHVARTVARRAERRCVALMENGILNNTVIHYLNRLSDYLFVLARVLNHNGKDDVLWQPGKNRPHEI